MPINPAVIAAIRRAALENDIDPATALAIAERESNFNPNAHSSKTIHGIFQMRGDLRHEYGSGDSNDPYEQSAAWSEFFKDNKETMARKLGRDPTDAEGYLGHHFGSERAARMLQMNPNTPVSAVFSPYERSINPHFDRAGTVGNLNSSIVGDINRKQAKYGGRGEELTGSLSTEPPDFSGGGTRQRKQAELPDFSKFGTIASEGPDLPQPGAQAQTALPDFSAQGTVASQGPEPPPQPSAQAAAAPPDLANQGTVL